MVGDFATAVAVCFKQERLEDALMLASAVSTSMPELWEATRTEYFRIRASPITSTIAGIVKGDLASLVAESVLMEWKETLAILCTYAPVESFDVLCEQLGDRLHAEAADQSAAIVVYLAGKVTQKVTALWVHQAYAKAADVGMSAALLELVEKAAVFRRAVYMLTGAYGTEPVHPEARGLADLVHLLSNEVRPACLRVRLPARARPHVLTQPWPSCVRVCVCCMCRAT
ncbi:hypothetical protein EON67_10325 [archaeon]|nr:MAG: hypothetical protein EON67_10325 [archaeon]